MPKENELARYLQPREIGEGAESLAGLCALVRDCPFEHIRYERHFSYDELIDDFTKRRRGACSAKHYFLGEVLSKKQFKVMYVTTPFLWRDLAVDYPVHLKNLADLMPTQLHLSLEVESNGIKIPIDATWDRGLEKAGFPISHFENGINGNIPAVRPINKETVHNSGLERFLYIESIKSKMDSTGIEPDFYKKLNLWLNSIRQS